MLVLRRLLILCTAALVVTAGSASAQSPGSRYGGRVSWVNASASSEELGDTGNTLELHSGFGFELDATLMFSDRFGVELSVGASTHRLCVSGGDWGEIDAGRVWLLPVTAIAQYHHSVYGPWDPYIGIGVSWVAPFYKVSADLSDAASRGSTSKAERAWRPNSASTTRWTTVGTSTSTFATSVRYSTRG
jgi:outer membrane protein W